LLLLFWVTLFSDGSWVAAAMAPATQITSISHRSRTENSPIPRKIESMCTSPSLRGRGDAPVAGTR
jgi:hypothetical protein